MINLNNRLEKSLNRIKELAYISRTDNETRADHLCRKNMCDQIEDIINQVEDKMKLKRRDKINVA